MTDHDDAPSGDDDAAEEFDRLTHALFEHISHFADEEDVSMNFSRNGCSSFP